MIVGMKADWSKVDGITEWMAQLEELESWHELPRWAYNANEWARYNLTKIRLKKLINKWEEK